MFVKTMRAAALTAAMLAGATTAHADKPKINLLEASFTALQPIRIVSDNGMRWTRILHGPVNITGNVRQNTENGILKGLRLNLGVCNALQCVGNPTYPELHFEDVNLLDWETSDHETYSKDLLFGTNPGTFPGNGGALSNNVQAQNLINTCNNLFDLNDALGQAQTAPAQFRVSVGLQFFTSSLPDYNEADDPDFPHDLQSEDFPVHATVICEPLGAFSTEDISAPPVPFKVTSVDLDLKAFDSETTQPNPGTVCQKGRRRIRARTTTEGNVKFRVTTFVGDAPVEVKIVHTTSQPDGNGGFQAEYIDWISVSKTSYVQSRVVEGESEIGLTTPWEDITLTCTDPGGGGATADLPDGDDTLPDPKKLSGDFSFVDSGSTKCPRKGSALINFTPVNAQNVHWSLDCLHGHFSGVAKTVVASHGGYAAPAFVSFDVKKTLHAKCALKTVAPGEPKLHTLKGHIFKCITPVINPASDDITADPPRPDPVKPLPPSGSDTVGVDPGKPGDDSRPVGDPPRYTCVGGRIVTITSMPPKTLCKCNQPGWTPIPTGSLSWKCVNKGKRGDSLKVDKTRIEAEKAKKRRDALKAAREADKRRKAAEETAKRRKALKAAQDAAKRRNALKAAQDAAKRRKALKAAQEAAKRRKALEATKKARTRSVPPKRRKPNGNPQLMLQRRR